VATGLTQRDLQNYHVMKSAGILKRVDGYALNAPNGVVLIACSDPYRRRDIIEHKEKILLECFAHRNVFPIMIPGGALRLWKRSPVNRAGGSLHKDLLDMIILGMGVLGTDLIELYVHGPCGCAAAAEISYLEEHDILFKAKEYVKQKIAKARVACYTHIDRKYVDNKDEMNTYFMRRATYYPWRRNNL